MKINPIILKAAKDARFDLAAALKAAIAVAKARIMPGITEDDIATLDDIPAAFASIIRDELQAAIDGHDTASMPQFVQRAWKPNKYKLLVGLPKLAAVVGAEMAAIIADEKSTIMTEAGAFAAEVEDAFA